MPPFLKRIRTRTSERLDRAAVGTSQPAGSEPAAAPSAGKPSARERGAMRRRLRRLARMREAMLLDLGALTFEMHRQERQDPALIKGKVKEALAVDAEARALAEALDHELPFTDLVASGIAGTCAQCDAILAADARYCSSCGTAAGTPQAAPATPEQPVAPAAVAPAAPTPDAGNGRAAQNGGRAPAPWAEDLK